MLGALADMMIGGIYLALFDWSKRDLYFPFLLAPFFYFTHSLAEIWIGLLPYDILPISIEKGWIGTIPLLVTLLPYIYGLFRIGLVWLFVKGLMNANKLKQHVRIVNSYIAVHGKT